MNDDDRAVANVLMMRAKRTAGMALVVGGGAAVLGVVPHVAPVLPFRIYALCAVLPVVAGLAAVPGGVLSLRTFSGQEPGVERALKARGIVGVGLQAGIGIALGAVAILLGALALAWMQVDMGPLS
jgi:hypothetical protein